MATIEDKTSARSRVLYSGGLRAFPGIDPVRLPEGSAAERLAQGVLRDVREALSAAGKLPELDFVEGDDFEDFWEDACRVSAAFAVSDGRFQMLSSPRWRSTNLEDRLGPIRWDEEGGRHGADQLLHHPIVLAHGGRPMAMTTLGEDETSDAPDGRGAYPETSEEVARLAGLGYTHVVLKSHESKGGVWRLPASTDPQENYRAIISDEVLGWTSIRLGGLPGALSVQAWVPMRHEYRLFVVDGEIISGAGCVEEFTPLSAEQGPDGQPLAFDLRTRAVRGHLGTGEPSPVEVVPGLVEAYLDFAGPIAAEHGGTVVIDVALVEGKPVVVELNGVTNAGLYASNPWAVARALAAAEDRGYGHLKTSE